MIKGNMGKKTLFTKRNIVIAVLIAAVAVTCILLVVLMSPKEKQPQDGIYPESAYGLPVYTDLLDPDLPGRPGTKRTIKYIVIHETGNVSNGAGAQSHNTFLHKGGEGKTSWHYTVDDTEAYHHIPDDEIAWHASSDDGNEHGIGMELCVNADGDFDKTFDNGARLTAYLLNAYKLKVTDIRQHGDFTDKNCPATIRDEGRWDEFIKLVTKYKKQEISPASSK